MSRAYGFLLEFIPMKIGAGMTFLEVALTIRHPPFTIYHLLFGLDPLDINLNKGKEEGGNQGPCDQAD